MASLTPDILSQLLDYPSQPPPPGVMPNFVNPDSIAYQMYITAGVCISLMVVFSLLRFVSKIYYCRRAANVGEEIFFATGLVLCLAFIAMTIACVTEGAFGRHAWDVTLGDFTKSQLVLDLLIEIIGPLAICAVKISVLILYLRIFSVLNWMRIASIAGIVIITAWHLSMSIAFTAMCSPSPSAGTSQLDFLAADVSNTCSRTRVLVVLQGVSNITIDLFLLVLPLPAIWRTQMSLRRKLTTSAMFSIGLCACVSSVIGLVYRVRFYRVGSDNTFLVVPLWATAIAEEAAGVIICCLPSTVIIFKSVKKPVLSWLSSVPQRLALQRKWPESSVNPRHSHLSPRSPRHILSDIEVDSYSLLQLNPGNTGIVKKTEWEVLRV